MYRKNEKQGSEMDSKQLTLSSCTQKFPMFLGSAWLGMMAEGRRRWWRRELLLIDADVTQMRDDIICFDRAVNSEEPARSPVNTRRSWESTKAADLHGWECQVPCLMNECEKRNNCPSRGEEHRARSRDSDSDLRDPSHSAVHHPEKAHVVFGRGTSIGHSMATSGFSTTQYAASQFVESAGAIVFHVAQRQICLVRHRPRDEWLLAKGRRNVGESRVQAALREAREETGFACDVLRMDMVTRAPPAMEVLSHYPDEPRMHEAVTEPFAVTICEIGEGSQVKFIWWYLAAIRGSRADEGVASQDGEEQFEARLFDFEGALERLTYQSDREIVRKAVEIYEANETGVLTRSA
nr:hypothetical protein CFP56_04278 [Quercus suber]